MRDALEEIDAGVRGEVFQSLAVPPESGDALIPRPRRRRPGRGWPVLVGARLDVGRIATELQDVVLGEPHMLQELPRRPRQSLRCRTPDSRRNALHGRVEPDLSVLPVEELSQVRAERLVSVFTAVLDAMTHVACFEEETSGAANEVGALASKILLQRSLS
jgi:hypothetical protein